MRQDDPVNSPSVPQGSLQEKRKSEYKPKARPGPANDVTTLGHHSQCGQGKIAKKVSKDIEGDSPATKGQTLTIKSQGATNKDIVRNGGGFGCRNRGDVKGQRNMHAQTKRRFYRLSGMGKV